MRKTVIILVLVFLVMPSTLSPSVGVSNSSKRDQFLISSSSIDLEMSTFFGGDREDTGADACFDSDGNIIVVGSTLSDDLAVTNAQQDTYGGGRDTFVLKLDTSYNVTFCTYYGGSGEEYPMAVVTDDDNNIIVTGHTESNNLPVPNGLQSELQGSGDAFVAKFDPTGTLIFGTYIGGNGANEWINAITLDENNNLIMGGLFESDNLNTSQNAFQEEFGGGPDDVVVLSLTPDGQSMNFMTYFGVDDHENCAGITLDAQNNIIITGYTIDDGITTEGAYQEVYGGGDSDAYIAKFDSNCQNLLWSTFIGGDSWDFGGDVSVDDDDNIIASGYSWSSDFPLQNELYGDEPERDTYLATLSENGSELLFSTLLGGDGEDRCYGMMPLGNGSIATCSMTRSTDMPTVNAWQENNSGSFDAYFALYDNNLDSLICSSYLGGSRDDNGLSLDIFNDEYVVLIGHTSSDDFPTNNPIQEVRAGNRDAFVTVLDLIPDQILTTTTPPPDQIPLEILAIGIAIPIVAVVIIILVYNKKKR